MCETDGVMTGTRWRAAILSMLLAAAPFSGVLATGQQQAPQAAQADLLPANEVLNYQIEWRLIPAGTAKLTWAASNLKLHIESSGLVSRLYHVDDEYGAALTKDLCVQSSFLTAHEGSRNRDTRVNYDSADKKGELRRKGPEQKFHHRSRVGHSTLCSRRRRGFNGLADAPSRTGQYRPDSHQRRQEVCAGEGRVSAARGNQHG